MKKTISIQAGDFIIYNTRGSPQKTCGMVLEIMPNVISPFIRVHNGEKEETLNVGTRNCWLGFEFFYPTEYREITREQVLKILNKLPGEVEILTQLIRHAEKILSGESVVLDY